MFAYACGGSVIVDVFVISLSESSDQSMAHSFHYNFSSNLTGQIDNILSLPLVEQIYCKIIAQQFSRYDAKY